MESLTIYELMKENREKRNSHANYFSWVIDRDQEEGAVVNILLESLDKAGTRDLDCIKIRGRGKDPPDCEVLDTDNRRVAIEVTEFVDSEARRASSKNEFYLKENEWTQTEFLGKLAGLLEGKADKKDKLYDGPYRGGYRVLVYCDEPELNTKNVGEFLDSQSFDLDTKVDRAYFLLSYDPSLGYCPVFELRTN